MGPVGHTVASLGIGGSVWAATGSLMAVPAAAAAGVLVDADHILDYFNWYWRRDLRRVFLLLHGWEMGIVGLLVVLAGAYHPVFLAAVLGYLGHVVGDHLATSRYTPCPIRSFQAFHGFDHTRLFAPSEGPSMNPWPRPYRSGDSSSRCSPKPRRGYGRVH